MMQVTPVVNIVSDFSEGIRLIKLVDNILEVRRRGRLDPAHPLGIASLAASSHPALLPTRCRR